MQVGERGAACGGEDGPPIGVTAHVEMTKAGGPNLTESGQVTGSPVARPAEGAATAR